MMWFFPNYSKKAAFSIVSFALLFLAGCGCEICQDKSKYEKSDSKYVDATVIGWEKKRCNSCTNSPDGFHYFRIIETENGERYSLEDGVYEGHKSGEDLFELGSTRVFSVPHDLLSKPKYTKKSTEDYYEKTNAQYVRKARQVNKTNSSSPTKPSTPEELIVSEFSNIDPDSDIVDDIIMEAVRTHIGRIKQQDNSGVEGLDSE